MIYLCVRDWVPMCRSGDKLQSVLSIYHVGPGDGTQVCQAWWQVPLRAEPSHLPEKLLTSVSVLTSNEAFGDLLT